MARRSARLSKTNRQQSPPAESKAAAASQLGFVLENDEFEDAPEHQSIDSILEAPSPEVESQLNILKSMKTPKTEPRPSRGEMHPKTIHQTTTQPDSGFKLGFVDVGDKPRRSAASVQNTPSRAQDSPAKTQPSSAFQFNLGSESHLSDEAKKLMDQVREEAARIRTEMEAERDAQDQKDVEAEHMFNGLNASGRKIAKPKPKAGRFSDVHMAQFKKMDSIANHPSSFRAKPAYSRPTTQSLKRSGSRAGLDEPERPRTAGKGTPGKMPPPFAVRYASASPFKSNLPTSERLENPSPAKRVRRSVFEDVSASRPTEITELPRQPTLPNASSTLFSPTKASLARSSTFGNLPASKPSMIPRSNSTKSVGPTPKSNRPRFSSATVSRFTSKLLEARQEAHDRAVAQSAARGKPLPPLPVVQRLATPTPSTSMKFALATPTEATTTKQSSFSSKLPTFSGLRSILRSTRHASNTDRPGTPKRPNTATKIHESSKKVDFTPSVKSRYAVKLAASSPSPAKLSRDENDTPKVRTDTPYDPAAYVLDDGDETWEEASSPVAYPSLPPEPASGPVNHTVESFMQKAQDLGRRESKEFKSIFTTLHPAKTSPPSTLTSVNSMMNRTNPTAHVNKVMRSPSNKSANPSSSTIRRVRTSGVADLVQPFEDTSVHTMPHGLPAKKRRRTSFTDEFPDQAHNAKENSHQTFASKVPGEWNNTLSGDDSADADDEGERRGGKRARTTKEITVEPSKKLEQVAKSPLKKSAAREQAAQSAKARKTRGQSLGGLSMSRLNALARPKSRG